jgi:hypothetical protein
MSENGLPLSPAPSSSRRNIAIGAAAAAVVASAAVVLFLLPAEFGVDPTGFGRATGLMGLAQQEGGEEENIYLKRGLARTNVLIALTEEAKLDEATLRKTLADKGIAMPDGAMRTDRYEVELMPYEGIEMKYDLAEGAPMIFRWKASAPVYLDLHSHPFDGGPEMTESFVIDQMPSQTAVYVAPFNGIHGWYWQNRTLNNVTLTLDAAGHFTASRVFSEGGEHPRPLGDEQAALDGAQRAPE